MTDVVPAGPASLPFDGLAKLLASSGTFRIEMSPEALGEEPEAIWTEESVLTLIDYPSSTRDGGSARPAIPLAVITSDDGDEWQMTSEFHTTGTLLLSFLFKIPTDYLDDQRNAELHFRNLVGQIFVEMFEKANTPAGDGSQYWNMIEVRQVFAPAECDRKNLPHGTPPYYGATYEVRWV